jgi:hypothetical protein
VCVCVCVCVGVCVCVWGGGGDVHDDRVGKQLSCRREIAIRAACRRRPSGATRDERVAVGKLCTDLARPANKQRRDRCLVVVMVAVMMVVVVVAAVVGGGVVMGRWWCELVILVMGIALSMFVATDKWCVCVCVL